MNLDTRTPDELRAIISQASSRLEQLARDDAATQDSLRADIAAAVTALDALIGDGDPKGVGSITAVRHYTGAEMAANADIALPLAFHGLDILARVTRDIARTAGH